MANVFMGGPQNKKKTQPTFGAQTNSLGMGTTPQQKPNQQQVGTGFTNLNKLMGANVGEGSKLATGLGVNQGRQVEQASQAQQQARSNVQAGVNTAQNIQSGATGLTNKVTGATTASDLSNLSPEDMDVAGKIASGNYGIDKTQSAYGTDMGKVGQSVGNVAGTTQGLQTEGGRSGLLSQYLRRPTQKSGLQALANTLLQTEGQQQLKDLQRKSSEDLSKLGEESTSLQGFEKTLSDLATSGSSITDAFKKTLGDKMEGLKSEESKQAEAARQNQDKVYKTVQDVLTAKKYGMSPGVTVDQLVASGVPVDVANTILNESYGTAQQLIDQMPSWLSKSNITSENMYSADDVKGLQNVAKLLGQDTSQYKEGTVSPLGFNKQSVTDTIENQLKNVGSDIEKIKPVNQNMSGYDIAKDKGAKFNQYRKDLDTQKASISIPKLPGNDFDNPISGYLIPKNQNYINTVKGAMTPENQKSFDAAMNNLKTNPKDTTSLMIVNGLMNDAEKNIRDTSNIANSQWTQLSNLFKNYNYGGF